MEFHFSQTSESFASQPSPSGSQLSRLSNSQSSQIVSQALQRDWTRTAQSASSSQDHSQRDPYARPPSPSSPILPPASPVQPTQPYFSPQPSVPTSNASWLQTSSSSNRLLGLNQRRVPEMNRFDSNTASSSRQMPTQTSLGLSPSPSTISLPTTSLLGGHNNTHRTSSLRAGNQGAQRLAASNAASLQHLHDQQLMFTAIEENRNALKALTDLQQQDYTSLRDMIRELLPLVAKQNAISDSNAQPDTSPHIEELTSTVHTISRALQDWRLRTTECNEQESVFRSATSSMLSMLQDKLDALQRGIDSVLDYQAASDRPNMGDIVESNLNKHSSQLQQAIAAHTESVTKILSKLDESMDAVSTKLSAIPSNTTQQLDSLQTTLLTSYTSLHEKTRGMLTEWADGQALGQENRLNGRTSVIEVPTDPDIAPDLEDWFGSFLSTLEGSVPAHSSMMATDSSTSGADRSLAGLLPPNTLSEIDLFGDSRSSLSVSDSTTEPVTIPSIDDSLFAALEQPTSNKNSSAPKSKKKPRAKTTRRGLKPPITDERVRAVLLSTPLLTRNQKKQRKADSFFHSDGVWQRT